MRPTARQTVALLASALLAPAASAQLSESNVLVLYNSQSADSLAIRDMYIERHPGVHEFDLNDAVIADDGAISRPNYLNRIATPLREFVNGNSAPFVDLSQDVMCIVTTRGIPGIINRFQVNDEFQINSTWTSVESELTLLQQDLEQPGAGVLDFVFSGMIDNPYHVAVGAPISGFTRANVQTPRTFNRIVLGAGIETWQSPDLTPGDIYLVTRLDAAPTNEGTPEEITALQHVERLLDRSLDPAFTICSVQSLLDEYASPANELDDDGLGSVYPSRQDYELTNTLMTNAGFDVLHDQTTNFIEGDELPDTRPVLVLGTYGENHNQNGFGDPAPGASAYLTTFDFHPASIFVSIESFNGTSIWSTTNNRVNNQEQVLDFISRGGSFTVGNVREPFSFSIADLEFITRNMLLEGMTFAEAAYSAIPALSWMQTPVGDPLARMNIIDPLIPDRDGDGDVDIEDLVIHTKNPVDLTCDGIVDAADTLAMRNAARAGEPGDVTTR